MRFLIDNALSPQVADGLSAVGHDAVHVRERGLANGTDEAVCALAAQETRVIDSADTDFGTLLAQSRNSGPSIILFRGASTRAPEAQVRLLVANLSALATDLEVGCVAVFDENRIRVRRLPIGG